MKKIIIASFLLISICSCNNDLKERELDLIEKELELREKELSLKENTVVPILSTNEAVRIAEKKFKAYLPKILKSHGASLDLQASYTGDFTGDGIEDVVIYFNLSPTDGGNASLGQGLVLYQNTGDDAKVIAGYEPEYLFSFNHISNGRIIVDKWEYIEGDAHCCPSIQTTHSLTISGSNVF